MLRRLHANLYLLELADREDGALPGRVQGPASTAGRGQAMAKQVQELVVSGKTTHVTSEPEALLMSSLEVLLATI